jgi:hypothetical protein
MLIELLLPQPDHRSWEELPRPEATQARRNPQHKCRRPSKRTEYASKAVPIHAETKDDNRDPTA